MPGASGIFGSQAIFLELRGNDDALFFTEVYGSSGSAPAHADGVHEVGVILGVSAGRAAIRLRSERRCAETLVKIPAGGTVVGMRDRHFLRKLIMARP